MAKRMFLRRLYFALWGGFSRKERRDVVADYEGFFIESQGKGASEADVAGELGEPSVIALNLAKESGKRAPLGALMLRYWLWVNMAVGGVVFFGTAMWFHSLHIWRFPRVDIIRAGIIAVILMSGALYFAFMPKIKAHPRRGSKRGIMAANFAIFVLGVFCIWFFNSEVSLNFHLRQIENVTNPHLSGIFQIRFWVLVLGAGIGLWAIVCLLRGKARWFITAVHAVGFCIYLETIYKLWNVLDSIEWYWIRIAQISAVYAVSLAITLTSAFFLQRKGAEKNA